MSRLVVIVGALSFALGVGAGRWLERKPAPAPSVKVAVQASRAAHAVAAKVDTVYRTQRAAEQVARVQYDSTHDTITVVRDSVRTVYVEKAVADREIGACSLVITTCDQRHTADSLEKARLHDEMAARDADRPSRLHTLLVNAAIAGIAYEAGRHDVGKGLNLSLRVPFR